MDPIERLRERERLAELGGGEERLKKQHQQGKLTARERMTRLFDAGTFEEVDKLVTHRCTDFGMENQIIPGDGVVTGHGRINGRVAYAFAQACGERRFVTGAGAHRAACRAGAWCGL